MSGEPMPETIRFQKKPARVKLKKRTIEALPLPVEVDGKPAKEWAYDTETQHLAMCLWSTGARTWVWVGRCPRGRMLKYKLGKYPGIGPEQARKLANKVTAEIGNGIDPRVERRRARTEMNVEQLFERYLEEYAKPNKKTWENDEWQFNKYCGGIKPRALSTLASVEIRDLHARIGKEHGKYAANRVLALLSKIYSYARNELHCPVENPVLGIRRFKEKSRARRLEANELKLFFDALEKETQLFQDFFTVLLFTGARRGNVQAMRFDQINFGAAKWLIPDTKNNDWLVVPLIPEVMEILLRRQAESNGNPWVFPGGKKNPTGHMNSPKGAWARILKRAGLQDARMHDLRRTMGSWQADTGASLPVIGKGLGHRSQQTTQIYARLNVDPVRESFLKAVGAMKEAASGKVKEGGEQ